MRPMTMAAGLWSSEMRDSTFSERISAYFFFFLVILATFHGIRIVGMWYDHIIWNSYTNIGELDAKTTNNNNR